MTTTIPAAPAQTLGLRVGDLVEVRSQEEILATLGQNGELDSLPFMPEMLQYCGQRLTVQSVAHKLCDTISYTGIRKMHNAVHLAGARCDGSAHGGCQTACLIYWKEAWLKRIQPDEGKPANENAAEAPQECQSRISLPLLEATARKAPDHDGAERFSCQATELLRAAPERFPLRDFSQYALDLRSGNASLPAIVRAFLVGLFNRVQSRSTKVLPRGLWFRGGRRWGFLEGKLEGRTPTGELGLQPGELVQIKSKDEILATLNKDLCNRGMAFEAEMARYCGREARVIRRVHRIIDEKTGRMLLMKSPCIVLEAVVCGGVYTASCPRAFYPFWREIWLERVEESR